MKPFTYMGGKQKHAARLVTAISETLGLSDGSLFGGSAIIERFYDPFCGSLAMSLEVLKRFPSVKIEASDASPIIDFYEHMREVEELPSWMLEWVDSKEYKELPPLMDRTPEEWWKGYSFSFGLSMVSYLASPEKEPIAKGVWEAKRDLLVGAIEQAEYERRIAAMNTLYNTASRTYVCLVATQIWDKGGFKVPDRISLARRGYEEMPQPGEGSVVYLDPPYRGTNGYGFGFSTQEFDEWANNLQCPVFVSEYTRPEGEWKEVMSFEVFAAGMGKDASTSSTERLFWNGRTL